MSKVVVNNTTRTVTVASTGKPGPVGLNWRGEWVEGVGYQARDAVYHDGSSYRCVEAHTSSEADEPGVSGKWQLLASGFVTEHVEQLLDETAGLKDEAKGYRDAAAGLRDAASDEAKRADREADRAAEGANRAEVARDAAAVNANVYADIAAGLAATANGQQFQVVAADRVLRYRNASGAAVLVASYPSAGFVDSALLRELLSIGPTTLVSGSNQSSASNTIYLAEPVVQAGTIRQIVLSAGAAGTIKVKVLRPTIPNKLLAQSGQLNVVVEQVFNVVPGVITLPSEIPVQKGDFLGFFLSGAAILHRVSVTSPGYGTVAGDVSAIPTPSIASTAFQHQIQFRIYSDKLAGMERKLDVALYTSQVLGTPSPKSGTNASGGATRVFRNPVKSTGAVTRIRWYASGPASAVGIRVFESVDTPGVYRIPQVGDAYTQTGEDQIIFAKDSGLNEVSVNIPVKAGDVLGLFIHGYQRVDEEGAEFMGVSGDLTSFNWAGGALLTKINSPQVAFDIELAQETGSAGVESWEVSEPRPNPIPPRAGVVLGSNVGLVWSDGTRWFKSGPRLPQLDCYAAIIVRESDRSVLMGKNTDAAVSAYSTVKLMTALVTEREVADWSTLVTMDVASGIYQTGDVISYEDLIHAALMPSDNEAAMALGRFVGKVIDPGATTASAATAAFLAKMNEVALEVGMVETNPYSSTWGGGVLSARSQAKLLLHMAAFAPKSIAAAGTLTYTLNIAGPNARTVSITHSAASGVASLLPEFVAGKTGTGDSLGNLSMLCNLDGERHAAVVLQSDNSGRRYQDMRKVLDHGYYTQNAWDDIL